MKSSDARRAELIWAHHTEAMNLASVVSWLYRHLAGKGHGAMAEEAMREAGL